MTSTDVAAAFQELSDLASHGTPSGQKLVFFGLKCGLPVVVKVIKPTSATGDALTIDIARTEREIEAVAKLRLPNVPRVLEHGWKTIGGQDNYYIVEERAPGENLRTRIQRGPLPLQQALTLLCGLLKSLATFEESKVVHRDIKPENLLIEEDGTVHVIDFGLARILDMPALTPMGPMHGVGTPGYAPPEQFQNIQSEIDTRADLYSCGVVFYEAVTGRNPYLDHWPLLLAVLQEMLSKDLPKLSLPDDTDGALAEFIGCLTSRFPARRPQNAAEAVSWFYDVKAKLAAGRTSK